MAVIKKGECSLCSRLDGEHDYGCPNVIKKGPECSICSGLDGEHSFACPNAINEGYEEEK